MAITVHAEPRASYRAENIRSTQMLHKWAADAAEQMARQIDREILAMYAAQVDTDTIKTATGVMMEQQRTVVLNRPASDYLSIADDWEEKAVDRDEQHKTLEITKEVVWHCFSSDGVADEMSVDIDIDDCAAEIPDPGNVFAGKDLDEVQCVLGHYNDLLVAIGNKNNSSGSAKVMLQCDDCGEGPCDVTLGVEPSAACHRGENFREDGFYVGKF